MNNQDQTQENSPVLTVKNLSVDYLTRNRVIKAVNDISFSIMPGEILGLIGESGSGKSTAAMAVLRLLPKPGQVTAGQIILENKHDLLQLPEKNLRRLRWSRISMVAQGAMNALNPTMKIKDQIGDGIKAHDNSLDKDGLQARILSLLTMVGLPERVYDEYPHKLSGGMKQRVGIAMAIALNPALVIADEPTSALDVITQRKVAQVLLKIVESMGVSMLLIGHDIGLISQLADQIAVMYGGHILEIGPVEAIFQAPGHRYTQILFDSSPSLDERESFRIIEKSYKRELEQQLRLPKRYIEVGPGHWVTETG